MTKAARASFRLQLSCFLTQTSVDGERTAYELSVKRHGFAMKNLHHYLSAEGGVDGFPTLLILRVHLICIWHRIKLCKNPPEFLCICCFLVCFCDIFLMTERFRPDFALK
jgi:hypothetical protein